MHFELRLSGRIRIKNVLKIVAVAVSGVFIVAKA